MKHLKKLLVLALAVMLVPAAVMAVNSQKTAAKPESPSAKAVLSGKFKKNSVAVPAPVAAVAEEAAPAARGQYDYNPPCPAPGRDIYPKIEDQIRLSSILELIGKIYRGEQLPYSHDGIVFQNKEGKLPQRPYGFYHEYTLLPPGAYPSHVVIGGIAYPLSEKLGKRGAERIIIGGGQLIYYTPDHYRTFIQLQMVY